MAMTPVLLVSLVLQVVFILVQDKLPAAFPKWLSSVFFKVIAVASLVSTVFNVSAIGLFLDWNPWVVTSGILILAISPPIAGLIENHLRPNGQDVFALERLPGHLLTNALGGLAVAAFLWAARTTSQFDEFNRQFGDDAAFNIALPLATAVAIAFARSEQDKHGEGIDLRTATDEAADPVIVGYSLRHVHQLMNTLYLATMVFAAGATMLYLFAQAISSAKAGEPLTVSWQVVVSIAMTMLFFLSCGLPWSRGSRTVWMTFATGTPAVLVVALTWLALFQNNSLRNTTIVLVVGGAYLAYCIVFILAERDGGKRIEAHYFSSVIVFFVLATIMGAIYLS